MFFFSTIHKVLWIFLSTTPYIEKITTSSSQLVNNHKQTNYACSKCRVTAVPNLIQELIFDLSTAVAWYLTPFRPTGWMKLTTTTVVPHGSSATSFETAYSCCAKLNSYFILMYFKLFITVYAYVGVIQEKKNETWCLVAVIKTR